MDALLRAMTSMRLARGRSSRRGALKIVPNCDSLEGRRLLSTAHKAATAAAATTTMTTTTRSPTGTTFAADLQLLREDDQALIVDVEADSYDALALQSDLQAVQAEATTTPSAAVKNAFLAQLEGASEGFNSEPQLVAFTSAFTAFLQGEGITDKALISKTIADQQALARTLELPEADSTRVYIDRLALANDLGFGTLNYSTITDAGPAAASKIAEKSIKAISKAIVATAHPSTTTAAAKAAAAGQAKLAASGKS